MLNERKYMTDKEILDKYINLEDSCLNEKEIKQVMEMLYEYKDVFSFRDEIGMCPNIEVNIEVTDSSPFFIQPYHVKEEDRAVLDKEMRRLCYLGILKEGFSAYSSPVMLISRKMTSDKRVVTDFRHLNTRIAKNNLAYPLLRDTFSLLGSSKCKVMSCIGFKGCISFFTIVREITEVLQNFSIFWQCIIFISEDAYGIKHFSTNMANVY